jgi:hypothetical protein
MKRLSLQFGGPGPVPGQAKTQPTYNFTTLDVPGASVGTGFIYAQGINDSGQIVGFCYGTEQAERGHSTNRKVEG